MPPALDVYCVGNAGEAYWKFNHYFATARLEAHLSKQLGGAPCDPVILCD